MKLTNGEIFTAKDSFLKLFNLKWPVRTAYALARLGAELNEQLRVIDEVRNALIRKHGEQDERGQWQVKQDSDGWALFVQDWTELLSQETDFPLEKKIKLPNNDFVGIEPIVLLNLEKFIEVE